MAECVKVRGFEVGVALGVTTKYPELRVLEGKPGDDDLKEMRMRC